MAEKMEIEKKKVLTPEFRVSFPHVFEKHTAFEGQEAKFSCVMLFPKKTDLKELKRAVTNAATEKWGPKEKWPKNMRMPFRDGDEKSDLSGYEGTIFVSASSKQKPQVIGNKKVDGAFPRIEKEDEQFYAGCYARATLIAFAYDKAGNKGVSFSLQNLQKLKDGEQFSGRKNADDEFDEVDDGSDDSSNYESAGESDDLMGF